MLVLVRSATSGNLRTSAVRPIALVALLGALGWTSSAVAAPPAAVQFASTGAQQQYVVPAGVRQVNIEALGGNGGQGAGAPGSEPPQGADIVGWLPVTPGEILFVEVGTNGTAGGLANFGGGGAGAGGGTYASGSGGGASDVRTCSATAPSCAGGGTSLSSRLVVAAGAGGDPGGGPNVPCGSWNDYGQSANAYGQPGTPAPVTVPGGTVFPGLDTAGMAPDSPARGGSASGPGAGGVIPSGCVLPTNHTTAGSASGASGAGANGGNGGVGTQAGSGAGGGGGYFGGGGGASGLVEVQPCGAPNDCYRSIGMGGAPGSNFVSSSLQLVTEGNRAVVSGGITGPPFVAITPLVEIDSPASGATYTAGQIVKASWSCLSGFASGQHIVCTAPVASGSPIDTTTTGAHKFTVTNDNAPVTVSYTVVPRVTAAHIGARLKGELVPSGKGAGIEKLLRSGSLTMSLRSLEAGTTVIDWFTVVKHGKPVLVASGKLTVSGAGTVKLKVKLTPAGRRLLKHVKRLKLTAKGTFTPAGKSPVTVTATFTLKR